MFTISYDGTFIIKIITIPWYINIQVSSSSKTCGHVDIQVRNNVVLDKYIYIYICIQLERMFMHVSMRTQMAKF